MPQIEIRPVLSADISNLIQIDHACQTDYVWQMSRSVDEGEVVIQFREVRLPRSVQVEYPYPPTSLVENWKDRAGLLVASMDGEPVGYIGLSESKSSATVAISDLAVTLPHRRKGIATALLLAAQQWAMHRRMRSVALTVQSKNYPAIRLALKLGFDFCGYNDDYYANQDIALFFNRFLK